MCLRCEVISKAPDTTAASWDCACGSAYVLRRCSECTNVSQVSMPQRDGQPWDCMWCHALNAGFTARRDPVEATLGDLAVEMARRGLTFAAATGEPADTTPALVVTTDEISGYRITAVHGDVLGLVARPHTPLTAPALGLGLADPWGDVTGYSELLADSSNEARARMWREARERGANAVVGMRFERSEVGDAMSVVSAHGTAVTVLRVEG
jgi:uncharacterized protein YbjQ (UPF0145 family)